jgi:hypothetical protein
MGLARFECEAQRLSRPEQVGLAYELLKRARTQPVREWSFGFSPIEEIIH